MSNSYKSIFKTTLITGGSQVVVLFFQMLRAKVLAVLLGPAGTGIIGLYSATTRLVNVVANIGLSGSAVRQIAKDNKLENPEAIGKTLFVFRVLIRVTTSLAAIIMLIFSERISEATFGTKEYIEGIRWMSLVVFFTGISAGQYTLLQGLRRIRDLALSKIYGTFVGLFVSVTLIYYFREQGIVPYLISMSAATVLLSWYFASKVKIKSISVNWTEFKCISRQLLGMGLAFMTTGLVIQFTGYYSRVLIIDRFSVDNLGLYTASWTLSAVYVNFVLSAMGADFYPRLSGIIDDHTKAKKLIDEQSLVGMLISIAGIASIIGFAHFVLGIFYSSKFVPAEHMLQWMAAGMAIKVLSWPVGFIIVSKGKSLLFTITELTWAVLYIGFLLFFTNKFGLEGAGIAFFMAYAVHTLVILIAGYLLIGYHWKKQVLLQVTIFIIALLSVFIVARINALWSLGVNGAIILGLLIYSYFTVSKLLHVNFFKLITKRFKG